VSEYDCIGCKNCTHVCPKTFAIEDDYGRARAMQQGEHVTMKLQAGMRLLLHHLHMS
jgi:ferredoxin